MGLEDGFGSRHNGQAYLFIFLWFLELLFFENSKVLWRDAAGNEHAVSLQVAGSRGERQGDEKGDSLSMTASWIR